MAPESLKSQAEFIKTIVETFQMERISYLIITIISVVFMFYAIFLLINRETPNTAMLGSVFGSSGIVAFTTSRTLVFFNKSVKLLHLDDKEEENEA